MPSRDDVSYFGAGPAGLPTTVLETAAKALVNYDNTGLGLAEHSHRSEIANNILAATKADLSNYLDIPNSHEVIFMQGGGSGEFRQAKEWITLAVVPINLTCVSATLYNFVGFWVEKRRQKFLKSISEAERPSTSDQDATYELLRKAVKEELKVDYLVTGSWSLKASQEAARLLGPEHVNIVADAREANNGNFGTIPAESTWKLSKSPAMIYYCDNETVDGVEFPGFPKILERESEEDEPIIVADMSSNILSRRISVKNFSAIFFGAQKNLGTTGITVVIIKKNLLPPALATPAPILMRQLGLPIGPVVLDYATIAKNNSLYNTLSIFDVYVAGLVLKSLLETFSNKVDGQQALAEKKAAIIYGALEEHLTFYKVVPDKTVRSRMNICFRCLGGEEIEKSFLKGATSLGLLGLKGHRSVGGIRASNYNSVSLKGAQKLANYLKEFAKAK